MCTVRYVYCLPVVFDLYVLYMYECMQLYMVHHCRGTIGTYMSCVHLSRTGCGLQHSSRQFFNYKFRQPCFPPVCQVKLWKSCSLTEPHEATLLLLVRFLDSWKDLWPVVVKPSA